MYSAYSLRLRTHDQKVDFENHNSPIPGLTTKTVPDLHGVTFLIPQIQCYPGIPIYIYNAVSFFVRSNRPSFIKKGGGTKEICIMWSPLIPSQLLSLGKSG